MAGYILATLRKCLLIKLKAIYVISKVQKMQI